MFIYWKRRVGKKNKPSLNPRFYEISYYAYLVEGVNPVRKNPSNGSRGQICRDTVSAQRVGRSSGVKEKTPAAHLSKCYLGSIKEIGGEFSPYRVASFYLDVQRRLLERNFSQRKLKEVFKLIEKRFPKPKAEHLKMAERLM